MGGRQFNLDPISLWALRRFMKSLVDTMCFPLIAVTSFGPPCVICSRGSPMCGSEILHWFTSQRNYSPIIHVRSTTYRNVSTLILPRNGHLTMMYRSTVIAVKVIDETVTPVIMEKWTNLQPRSPIGWKSTPIVSKNCALGVMIVEMRSAVAKLTCLCKVKEYLTLFYKK